MKNIYIDDVNELITTLNIYQKAGYFFRGQRDAANWKLEPGIFRTNNLDSYIKKIIPNNVDYPFSNNVFSEWVWCAEVRDIVKLHTHEYLRYDQFHVRIKRLLSLCIYILKYNFYLGLYVETNPNNNKFDSETLQFITKIPHHIWHSKEKFLSYFDYSLRNLLTLTSLDGKLLKLGMHDNNITGYNQTFAQHYSFPTSALDFTEKYLIALYFALENGDKNDSSCFSVYAYKQFDSTENAPVILINEDRVNNIRAKNQEGVFLYIQKPFTYYLDYGTFPSVDKLFAQNENLGFTQFADLIKFNIPYKQPILNPLNNLLEIHNINKNFIRPDETQYPTLVYNRYV